jgi:hypothetical protein
LSDDIIDYLNTTPRLLEPWQQADIANNNVGGYFKNPVWNVANSTIVVSQELLSATFNINGTNSQTSNLLTSLIMTILRKISQQQKNLLKNSTAQSLF